MVGIGSGLWGKTLWGQPIGPLAGNPNVLDIASAFLDVIYRLGFSNTADITASSWVTPGELYQFADDAVKLVAYDAGVLITVDSSITVTNGTAVYNLPATHVFTIMAWLGAQALRPTTVRDLWALDGNWPTTSGPALRMSMDAGSVGTITLYPNPVTGGILQQVAQMYASIAAGASILPLPTVLQDYFSYRMLAGARGKESEAAMPEMAAHYEARCALYEQIMQEYWGPGM